MFLLSLKFKFLNKNSLIKVNKKQLCFFLEIFGYELLEYGLASILEYFLTNYVLRLRSLIILS